MYIELKYSIYNIYCQKYINYLFILKKCLWYSIEFVWYFSGN